MPHNKSAASCGEYIPKVIQFLVAGVPGGVRAGAYQWGIRRPDLQRADFEPAVCRGCGAAAAIDGRAIYWRKVPRAAYGMRHHFHAAAHGLRGNECKSLLAPIFCGRMPRGLNGTTINSSPSARGGILPLRAVRCAQIAVVPRPRTERVNAPSRNEGP